jgi:hypothetical protein
MDIITDLLNLFISHERYLHGKVISAIKTEEDSHSFEHLFLHPDMAIIAHPLQWTKQEPTLIVEIRGDDGTYHTAYLSPHRVIHTGDRVVMHLSDNFIIGSKVIEVTPENSNPKYTP